MTSEDAKRIREEFGMTRTAFARDVLKVPYSTVEKWERGDCGIGSSGVSLYQAVVFIKNQKKLDEWLTTHRSGV